MNGDSARFKKNKQANGCYVVASVYTIIVTVVTECSGPCLLYIFLSTGGYNHPNAARLWTSLTALTIGKTLDEDIPDHCNWPNYGPTYTLSVEPTLMKDTNKQSYLDECIRIINGG